MEENSDMQERNGWKDDVLIYIEPKKRAVVSLAMLVSTFGVHFSIRSFGLALPHIIANWNAGDLYSMGIALQTAAMTVSAILSSRIIPKWGIKKTICTALVMILISNIGTMFAPNMLVLMFCMLLTGIGSGTIVSQMVACVNKIWPTSKRGIWMAMVGIFQSAASVIGPMAAGLIIDYVGWQATYILVSILQVMGLFMLFIVCPKDTKEQHYKAVKFDVSGTGIFFMFIVSSVLVSNFGNSLGWSSPLILAGTVFVIIALIVLIKVEDKAGEAALLPWKLFTENRNFIRLFGFAFFICALGMSQTVFISWYMQKISMTSATLAGVPFTILSVGSLIMSPIMGRKFQKTGKSKNLIVFCTSLMTISVIVMTFWIYPEFTDSATGLAILFVLTAIYGIGYCVTMTLLYNACSEYLPKEQVGVATSNIYMGLSLGGCVGLAILQAISNAVNAVYGLNIALKVVFGICGISGMIALSFALSLKKEK